MKWHFVWHFVRISVWGEEEVGEGGGLDNLKVSLIGQAIISIYTSQWAYKQQ